MTRRFGWYILLLLLAVPATAQDEPLEGKELSSVLRDIGSKKEDSRQAAFDAVRSRGDEKAQERLADELDRYLERAAKDYRKQRTKSVAKFYQSARSKNGSKINQLRSRMNGLLSAKKVKEMKDLHNELRTHFWPEVAGLEEDRKYAEALALVQWYLSRRVSLGGTELDKATTIAEYNELADRDASLKLHAKDRDALQSLWDARDFLTPDEYLLVRYTNEYRMMMGLNALKLNRKLTEACRMHCKDMAEHNFYSHDSPLPGKKKFSDRARMHGETAMAENINKMVQDWEQGFWEWFDSAGHHENFMRPNWSQMGIGEHEGHWVELFK